MSSSNSPARRDPARTVRFRRRALLAFWLICGIGLTARSVELQLLQGAQWRAEAERQHRTTGEIPAARGAILDRDGVPLALSHETFRVSVAPHEVRDTTATVDRLVENMSISSPQAMQAFQTPRRWVTLSGRYPPATRDALEGLRGVYVQRELRRFYPHGDLLRGLLGSVIDEEGAGGVEQQFDEHLRGVPGLEVLSRDSEGRPIPGEAWMVEAPRSGGQVVLTLDADLQEIASEALREAIETTRARGGELLVTEPSSGEILAMVSVKDGATTHLGSINTPYEPGSTLKPFTVATLLHTGKASLADTVDTAPGQWRVAGRTITDVASPGRVDLGHALRVSSNVGVAKVAQRLSAAEQYEHLRDFGFGVPTGIDLPGEVGGTLRRPQQWTGQSPASLAIGYEISVTPLQMAMAYGALANGGTLMEPRMIREVRDPAGRTVERYGPRAVRQVVSEDVASEVTRALVEAVDDGTGGRARLATFAVAGKSGTSRAYGEHGGYEAGGYYASFVGFFPAEDPQLVVFVKLDRPRGEYYGGATAAPVTRATMEAVLAAHRSPLDRRALAAIARSRDLPTPAQPSLDGSAGGPTHDNGIAWEMAGPGIDGASVPRFVARPDGSGASEYGSARPQAVPDEGLLLPDLEGLPLRTAVRRLHGMGLSVVWEGGDGIGGTRPGAGAVVSPGDTIQILPASQGRAPPEGRRGVDDDD